MAKNRSFNGNGVTIIDNLKLEKETENNFNMCLDQDLFNNQGKDENDFGVDLQIEVIKNKKIATNFRIFVQLKGTNCEFNKDGSISRTVHGQNLKYLLANDYSIYICYNQNTKKLMACYAEDVLNHYINKKDKSWLNQETITVNLKEEFNLDFQNKLHQKVLFSKDKYYIDKINIFYLDKKDFYKKLKTKEHHKIPEGYKKENTIYILNQATLEGFDFIISNNFDIIKNNLDEDEIELHYKLYNAIVNMSIRKEENNIEIIEEALEYFLINFEKTKKINLLYSIANAYQSLNRNKEAMNYFEKIINNEKFDNKTKASCYQNIAGISDINDIEKRIIFYKKALEYNDKLNISLYSLGTILIYKNEFKEGLNYLDKIFFSNEDTFSLKTLHLYKSYALYNLREIEESIREFSYIKNEDFLFEDEKFYFNFLEDKFKEFF